MRTIFIGALGNFLDEMVLCWTISRYSWRWLGSNRKIQCRSETVDTNACKTHLLTGLKRWFEMRKGSSTILLSPSKPSSNLGWLGFFSPFPKPPPYYFQLAVLNSRYSWHSEWESYPKLNLQIHGALCARAAENLNRLMLFKIPNKTAPAMTAFSRLMDQPKIWSNM